MTETPTPSEAPRTPDVGRLGHVRITNSTRKPQDILAVIRDRSSDSRRCFVERFTLQPTSAEHNNDVQSFSGVAAIGMYVELSLQTARGLQTTFDWPVSRKTQSAVVVIHDDHIEHWFLPLEG